MNARPISDFSIRVREHTEFMCPLILNNPENYLANNINLFRRIGEFLKTFYPQALTIASNQLLFKGLKLSDRFFIYRDPFAISNFDWKLVYNPIITKFYGTPIPRVELCLSWDKHVILANRFLKIECSFLDASGVSHIKDIRGLEAQIFQHSIQHLDGIPETVEFFNNQKDTQIRRFIKCPCGSNLKIYKCCGKFAPGLVK